MLKLLCRGMTHLAIARPRTVIAAMVISTLAIVASAALPSLWPERFTALHGIAVDTDPENMLSEQEPVRLFHHEAKQRFNLSDMIVVGVTNPGHPQGAFNAGTLSRVYQLTEFAKQLQWEQDGERHGVISIDLLAPSTVDNIEQGGLGSVNFSWLMSSPPATDQEAAELLERAQNIPFLNGTLVSENGEALALYLPISKKELAYRIRNELLDFTQSWQQAGDNVYITGLPVAEDTFGVEMFIQMAISAPLAMLVIFVLLWLFFKKLILVASPMIVAMVASLATMGLLIATGNTIHIMSSMIPIFIMPIAVLDAVHILSEFFDRYGRYRDKRKTITEVIETLFAPMLFTTLTTMAGFASLYLTPIPPVQVFGLYIAIGVFLAWLWTMLFIPAYIMLIDERRLEGYGHHEGERKSMLGRALAATGHITTRRPWLVVVTTLVAVAVAVVGIGRITVNDNPTRWFEESHPIRVADRVLNEHFGGTYMGYLELAAPAGPVAVDRSALAAELVARQRAGTAQGNASAPYQQSAELIASAPAEPIDALEQLISAGLTAAESDADYYAWDDLQSWLDVAKQRGELFKQPAMLNWLDQLQEALLANPSVGKVNSLPDVVKTVHRELLLGADEQYRIPDTANAVGQTLITYQNSHRPHDLWHFVTPDYRHTVLWIQLTSGDNKDMEQVIATAEQFIAANPAPTATEHHWFGLTYINVVWQGKMVAGMLEAFLGSFVVVLVMMVLLFRSLLWGLLAMIPLAVTVGLIYGVIGLIGKDYDMPVAVLSALSLGLAVDYAIHFLARAREAVATAGSWHAATDEVFGEPARAISRNAIILGAGFTPLLAAPLVPYQTVGIFIASIIICAAVATLFILPALITYLQRWLFKRS